MKQTLIFTVLFFFHTILFADFDRALNQPVNLPSQTAIETCTAVKAEAIKSIGPNGARVQSILCMDNTVLAGTASGGLYKSANYGQSWEYRIIDPGVSTALSVGAIASTDSKIYAAAGCGLYVSHNRGDTWNVLLYDVEGYLTDIETDPFKSNTLYIGCYKGDVYPGFLSSSDGGLTWHSKNSGLTNTDILCLAASPFVEGLIYAGTTSGVFRTFNAGSDGWQNITGALPKVPVYSIACSNIDSATIWAGTNAGLYKSINSGKSWVQIETSSFKSQRINTITLTSDALLVGTANGLFKSKNDGQTWKPYDQGLLNRGTTTISCSNDSLLYVGTYDGFYTKQDDALPWKRSVDGMTGHEITDVLISTHESKQNIIVGTGGAGLFCYDNSEWRFISPDSGFFFVTDIVSKDSTLLTSGITYQRGLTNSIVYALEQPSLKEKSTHLLRSFINCVAFENCSTLLAGTMDNGLLRCPQDQTNWQTVSELPLDFISAIQCTPDQRIFVAGTSARPNYSGIYTRGPNSHWKNTTQSILDDFCYCKELVLHPSHPSTLYGLTTCNTLIFSQDDGQHWQKQSDVFAASLVVSQTSENSVFSFFHQINMSRDFGKTWQVLECPLPPSYGHLTTAQFFPHSSKILVGTSGAGIFSIDVPTRIAQQTNIPQTIHLQQNYPNPFNSTTTIQFSLANPSHVDLDIYNIKGQKVYSISKECVQAGEYSVKWDGENQVGAKVSAGVYLCRLTGEHFSKTIMMPLLP